MRFPISFAVLAFGALLGGTAVPATGGVTFDVAVAALESGDYEVAANGFQELIVNSPEWAGGYVVLGQCRYMLGRPDEAEQAIREAARIDSGTDLFAAFMTPGQWLYEARRFDAAARPLARAVEHAPETHHRPTALKLGYSYYLAGAHAEARTVLEGWLQLYGFDAEATYFLAIACRQTGDYTCAIERLARVAQSDYVSRPERKVLEYLATWSHYWALLPDNKVHRDALLRQALAHTRAWFLARPDLPATIEYHGRTLLAAGRADALIAEIAPAAERNPGNCPASTLVARAYNSVAQSALAERWARKAASCDPDSAAALVELAVSRAGRLRAEYSSLDEVREDQALTGQALGEIERALQLDPQQGSRATSLHQQLLSTTELLERTEQEFVRRDDAHDDDVADLIRQRCVGILWTMRDETRGLSEEDRKFYRANDCKRFKGQRYERVSGGAAEPAD